MSYEIIRPALETWLSTIQPPIPTGWEGVPFHPPATLYQKAYLLPAMSQNPSFGEGLTRESGILQVSVHSPLGSGPMQATSRAELIRQAFPRGHSIEHGNLIIRITKTPSLAPGSSDGKSYILPVSITFQCDVFS